MKNEQGFSLVELLIVVAIIAIIAAIAVPSLLTSRMAANEAGGIQGCRTAASAEVAYASTNNQEYTDMATLTTNHYLDDRYANATGFNGYTYSQDCSAAVIGAEDLTVATPTGFGIVATPIVGMARYTYGIAPDQVVRYQAGDPVPPGMTPGSGIGKTK